MEAIMEEPSIFDRIVDSTSVPRPRRLAEFGAQGTGKTTFAAGAEAPILLPTEDGFRNVKVKSFPLATNMSEVFEATHQLLVRDHGFKTFILDSVDWFERLIWAHICKAAGKKSISDFDFGKGYGAAAEKVRLYLEMLADLNVRKDMTIVLIAHAKIVKFDDPATESYDRYVPKLHEQVSAMIQEWCDEVFFVAHKVIVRESGEGTDKRTRGISGGDRVAYTTERPAHKAKNRLLGCPEELPLMWSAYQTAIANHRSRLCAGDIAPSAN